MMKDQKRIEVAAGVIRKNGMTLICSRPKNTSAGGFFEFPGGKCEVGETPEKCIIRELKEELGIDSIAFDRIHVLEHDYPEKKVRVHFIRCMICDDSPSPQPLDGQEIKWVPTGELERENFLPADLPLARSLAESYRKKTHCLQ